MANIENEIIRINNTNLVIFVLILTLEINIEILMK